MDAFTRVGCLNRVTKSSCSITGIGIDLCLEIHSWFIIPHRLYCTARKQVYSSQKPCTTQALCNSRETCARYSLTSGRFIDLPRRVPHGLTGQRGSGQPFMSKHRLPLNATEVAAMIPSQRQHSDSVAHLDTLGFTCATCVSSSFQVSSARHEEDLPITGPSVSRLDVSCLYSTRSISRFPNVCR